MILITLSWQVILAILIMCYLIWFIGKQITIMAKRKK
ncbi:Uncharacterised protein [Mammaliicoccus stepanovicii]|uniref:Uncharacterized protein n=1 Tax=Mammaliicoccus stepanovicii TaxID=643214 RepID=A0A239ZMN5_9STAP|nr:Uncharacterised protein [Mammaliicoccus stepanovicii]